MIVVAWRRAVHLALLLLGSLMLALGAGSQTLALAQPLEDDGGAEWRVSPIVPPELPSGQKSTTPIPLGHIGDVEFWAPNRGLLTTAGNGSTIPAGLWAYDGTGWHELANVCGATDGRIAWAAPDEFWTIADGRPGQAANPQNGTPAPTADNTLCHFAGGQVAGSYGSLAFRATSYQPMHAAACIGPSDCWFAGDPLPAELSATGSFHLHWANGSLAAEPYEGESQPVEDMRAYEHALHESVRISAQARSALEPPSLHLINPLGVSPVFEAVGHIPLYAGEEFPEALDFLHLSTDEEALWGAAGPQPEPPAGSAPAAVTVVRDAPGAGWTQVLGPAHEPAGGDPFPEDVVNAIAAEPGTNSAWLALDSRSDALQPSPTASAHVARVSATGELLDDLTLPSQQEQSEGIGPKGAAAKLACPAVHDCWLTTTQGWMFHLADEAHRVLAPDGDPAFAGLITFRPPDAGLPQVVPDAPPPDDSGLLGEAPPSISSLLELSTPQPESTVTVPLLSHLKVRLVHGTTLELRFHLAVKARVRLLARRKRKVVASTATHVFPAGDRKLLLRLDRRSWPTKLDLQSHALAKLPTASTRGAATNTVGTGFHVLPRVSEPTQPGPLG